MTQHHMTERRAGKLHFSTIGEKTNREERDALDPCTVACCESGHIFLYVGYSSKVND